MNERKKVETVMVLASPSSQEATLFCVVDGVQRYETIGEYQLLCLIKSAAESLISIRIGK